MLERIMITISSIAEMDKIALLVAKVILDGDAKPYVINIFGGPNSGKSTLANQIARQIAQSQYFVQSDHFDSQYGRAWQAWKSVSPQRLIRRIDWNASRVEHLQNPPIPALGKNDVDIWENSTFPSDIIINIKNFKDGLKELSIMAVDKIFIDTLKREFMALKRPENLKNHPAP